MSTRCNIKVIDNDNNELWFYKHSDGYPEGTLPILNKFMDWLKSGKIRNNLSQAVGWLVILGAMEYATIPKFEIKTTDFDYTYGEIETAEAPKDWKCGSIEPTTCQHGDIEYLYEINIVDKTLTYKEI